MNENKILIKYIIKNRKIPNKKENKYWRIISRIILENDKTQIKSISLISNVIKEIKEDWEYILKNLKRKKGKCVKCNKKAKYNYKKWEEWPLYCEEHKKEEMLKVIEDEEYEICKNFTYKKRKIKKQDNEICHIDPKKLKWFKLFINK